MSTIPADLRLWSVAHISPRWQKAERQCCRNRSQPSGSKCFLAHLRKAWRVAPVNWIIGDWLRILVVAGLVCATTGYVWVKVQISEAAMGIAQAREVSVTLREEHAKLEAAVDMAQRPGLVRGRAVRELHMVDATTQTMSELMVGGIDG